MLQKRAVAEWYPHLDKPALTPPDAAFPIAWGIIYLLMGISAGRILTSDDARRGEAMRIWYGQLAANFAWSILFFTCRSPLLGMIDIVLLDALVVAYIARSARIRRSAACLFVPYLAWILYATYLNGYILAKNDSGL